MTLRSSFDLSQSLRGLTAIAGFAAMGLILVPKASADSLTISISGVLPSACQVTLTYYDGDKNKAYDCTVQGSDDAQDAEFKCSLADGSIGHLNDGDSWASVGITETSIGSCLSKGGFTLASYSGNGSGSSDFQINNWKKGSNSEGNECVDDFFGKKSSNQYGTYWKVARFAGANGKLVDGNVMQAFQMNVSKDSSNSDHYKKVKSCQPYNVSESVRP